MQVRAELVDITTLALDAIVNAANEWMLGGGGVDGAIHAAAGPGLREACRAIAEVRPGVRCPTGEARITPGFLLPSRYVIHTVGPVWRGGRRGEPEQLAACYRSVLELVEANSIRTIAFPAISCGAFGFPLEDAASICIRELAAGSNRASAPDTVLLVAVEPDVRAALARAIRRSSFAQA